MFSFQTLIKCLLQFDSILQMEVNMLYFLMLFSIAEGNSFYLCNNTAVAKISQTSVSTCMHALSLILISVFSQSEPPFVTKSYCQGCKAFELWLSNQQQPYGLKSLPFTVTAIIQYLFSFCFLHLFSPETETVLPAHFQPF